MTETIPGYLFSTTALICISSVSVVSGIIIAIILNRKHIELQLKQSRESLDFALQSGRMGTWDVDLQNNTVSCSPEMLKLWGIKPEDFTGERSMLQSKVHPDDFIKMNTALNNAIKTDSIYDLEYRIHPTPGIERWVLSRGRCTFAPNSKVPIRMAGVVYDISDKKLRLEAMTGAVRTREQFYMMASHELRTPLTCLHLQMQVNLWDLQNNYQEALFQNKFETSLQKQQEHLLRITRIVDNILDESKISEGRFQIQREVFDLGAMVSEVLERFQVFAQYSGVKVIYHPSSSISGTWDKYRLEQVLHNLLMNAIRYGQKSPIHVEVSTEGENALMIVRDQGMGIKTEDQSRIFERFERAISDNEIRGMGLGLYISNNIVQAHGGSIRLKSEQGRGSEFSVIIPTQNTI